MNRQEKYTTDGTRKRPTFAVSHGMTFHITCSKHDDSDDRPHILSGQMVLAFRTASAILAIERLGIRSFKSCECDFPLFKRQGFLCVNRPTVILNLSMFV